MMMKKLLYFSLFIFFLSACKKQETAQDTYEQPEIVECVYRFGICIDSLDVADFQVRQGESLSVIYTNLGFSGVQSNRMVNVAVDLLPPRSLRAGMNYHVFTTQDSIPQVAHIAFARSRTNFVVLDLLGDSVHARAYEVPIITRRRYSEGVVNSSLWNAIAASGSDPILATMLSSIFAWQIDFFGIQRGDRYKLIYNAAYIENDTVPLRIESIEGVVFTHRNRDFYAIPFEQDSVRIFFDENGNSLRRAFLRAPLDFYRITSRFTNARFHPILRRYRPHHGVDYAAPTGTPVRTIGDGTVIERGYQRGGAGNFVRIRHNATYTTTYMHLSRFGQGIRQGARVNQGDIIGYVGMTGLATGPHLCFRVHRNGVPINPLTMEAPPDVPVHPELMDSFNIVKQNILNEIARFSAERELSLNPSLKERDFEAVQKSNDSENSTNVALSL